MISGKMALPFALGPLLSTRRDEVLVRAFQDFPDYSE
jgi:hypothetical protein